MTGGTIPAGVTPSRAKSDLMARVRTRDTAPEIAVRRAMHARGLRFRLHPADLPGRPDIVLPKHRTVVFVHGCYWHGCAMCDRGTRRPKTNGAFWAAKLAENQQRDNRNVAELQRLGWHVTVIWECRTRESHMLAATLESLLPFLRMKDQHAA